MDAIQANIKQVVVTIVPTESFLKISTVLAALHAHGAIMVRHQKLIAKNVHVVNMVIN